MTKYIAHPAHVARAHQALADVSRLRLLERLHAHPDGLNAAAAAAEVGLHPATVRQHLEMLVEAGLVTRAVEERSVRGRPRVIYRASGDREETSGTGYRLLTEILVSIIERALRRPALQAEAGGAAWGRALVERARPQVRLPRGEAMRRVTDLLNELGFDAEQAGGHRGRRILFHGCPFREVAAEHRSVVCTAHLGLIKGALDELGSSGKHATLEPLVTPNLCVARLGGSRSGG